ncbi:hypothetical protein FKM82_006069 [Ascaphus truei]
METPISLKGRCHPNQKGGKRKRKAVLHLEGTDTSADSVEEKGDRVALQPRENGEFVPRITEYPEGPRQKSCTPKKCLSGANSEEPSANHPREVQSEPVSDDPLTSPEDTLQAARHDCDLLCEELERERKNNTELQKTVLTIYSAAKTELEDLKSELDTAKATISAMEEKQSQSDKMVATLKRKYEEALKQMTVFQQEVHTLRIEPNASQQEVNSVRIEVDVSQKEVQTLRRALDASHHETNSCRTDLEVSRKELHSLTEELDIAKETIGNLETDLKVSQKELQTLNQEKEVSRQEIVILTADVRKWKDCKEALKNTETEKGENSRLKRENLKLKEENFQLTEEVKEKFDPEHRLQNQLQGLRTHLQYAEEKQQTLQEEKLQAAKESVHQGENRRSGNLDDKNYRAPEYEGDSDTQIPPIRKKVLALPKHLYPTVTNARKDKGTVRVGDSTQLQNKITKFEPPKKALAKPTAAQQATNRGRSAESKPEESLAEEAELATPWCGEAAERPLQEQKTLRASPNCSTTVAIHFVYKKRSARCNRNLRPPAAHAIKRLYVEKSPPRATEEC